jgi:hypothetical protein
MSRRTLAGAFCFAQRGPGRPDRAEPPKPESRNKLEHKTITCSEWSNDFLFTKGEQDYYAQKQLSDPKRCKPSAAN